MICLGKRRRKEARVFETRWDIPLPEPEWHLQDRRHLPAAPKDGGAVQGPQGVRGQEHEPGPHRVQADEGDQGPVRDLPGDRQRDQPRLE